MVWGFCFEVRVYISVCVYIYLCIDTIKYFSFILSFTFFFNNDKGLTSFCQQYLEAQGMSEVGVAHSVYKVFIN